MGGGMMMRRMDTDNDGKITRGEVETRLKSRFARLDLNNDGRITDADLPPMLRGRSFLAGGDTMHAGMGMRGHGQGGQGRMRGARGMMGLRGTDTNKDGAVTFEEFAARHFARFEARDRNKDAVIDTADFDAMRKEMLDYRVARFIHRFGPEADKARSVTREQFLALAKQRFERMDRNDDGRVDRQDRGGGRGEGRGRNRDNR